MNINKNFIKQASNILGDTNTGLTGSEIAGDMLDYAYKLNVDIPYPSSPFPKSTLSLSERYLDRSSL